MVTRRCPCGYETRATFRAGNTESGPDEPAITAEFSKTASETETAKWRSQLERKFEPAREKLPDMEEAQRLVDDMFRPDIPGLREARVERIDSSPSAESETSAVDYAGRIAEDEGRGEAPEPLMTRRPAQQALSLEPLIAGVTTSRTRPERDAKPIVSKEILFSRVLAGIVDLLLPIGTAVLFVFTACWLLNLDFFSSSATYSWLSLSLAFYLLNSIYFFWTAGRTPGMFLTDLQLSGEESEEPPLDSVIIRILVFLPVAITVIGLVLTLFDSECRGLHDRLSKTKVIPA